MCATSAFNALMYAYVQFFADTSALLIGFYFLLVLYKYGNSGVVDHMSNESKLRRTQVCCELDQLKTRGGVVGVTLAFPHSTFLVTIRDIK
ncbi:hypothetical protein Ddc_14896 [Ditylenchus destructor]|nr:hypothetical protein Ddc_14896 [Ditylenchus destructor]